MTDPITAERLAEIRERVADNAEGDVMFGRDEVADLLAEVDRLTAEAERWKERYRALDRENQRLVLDSRVPPEKPRHVCNPSCSPPLHFMEV